MTVYTIKRAQNLHAKYPIDEITKKHTIQQITAKTKRINQCQLHTLILPSEYLQRISRPFFLPIDPFNQSLQSFPVPLPTTQVSTKYPSIHHFPTPSQNPNPWSSSSPFYPKPPKPDQEPRTQNSVPKRNNLTKKEVKSKHTKKKKFEPQNSKSRSETPSLKLKSNNQKISKLYTDQKRNTEEEEQEK